MEYFGRYRHTNPVPQDLDSTNHMCYDLNILEGTDMQILNHETLIQVPYWELNWYYVIV